MADIVSETEDKMKKSLENARKLFASIRTGRASPGLLDHLTVEYYGSPVPLKQLATVSAPEARQLLVQPFDKGALSEIERAILKSDLGVSPKVEASLIRINLPQLTEERRKELVKLVRKNAEDSKVGIRNIRREALDSVKNDSSSGNVSLDAKKQLEERIQKMTDKYVGEVEQLLKSKEEEILTL